jgi:predicted translin family RNA/ssDNA-binding protein
MLALFCISTRKLLGLCRTMKYMASFSSTIKTLVKKYASSETKLRAQITSLRSEVVAMRIDGGAIVSDSKSVISKIISGKSEQANSDLKDLRKTVFALLKRYNLWNSKVSKYIAAGGSYGYVQDIGATKIESEVKATLEEYFEALFLYQYLADGECFIPRRMRDYSDVALKALADVCGELVRITRKKIADDSIDVKEIESYEMFLEEVQIALARYAFGNKSGVRGKIENVRTYQHEFTKLMYDLKMNMKKKKTS